MKVKQIIDQAIGWYGAGAIIGAFAMVSFEILSPTNLIYYILNGTGALGIVYISFKDKAYQPAVLNIIWAVIAGVAIIRLIW